MPPRNQTGVDCSPTEFSHFQGVSAHFQGDKLVPYQVHGGQKDSGDGSGPDTHGGEE
jgi:hypothetical protein